MAEKYMYAVLRMDRDATIEVGPYEVPIDLNWAEGMCGAIPVFKKIKDARRHAGKKYPIISVKEVA